jgi:hypothetical protein
VDTDRFDALARRLAAGGTRRRLLGGLALLGLGAARASAKGIAGGGAVDLGGERRAQVSLLATRAPNPAQAGADRVVGHLRWVEPDWEGVGLMLQNAQLVGYGPVADEEDGRELFGWLEATATAAVVPFYLRVVAGGAGRGAARIVVGDAVSEALVRGATAEPSGFAYEAEGTLTSGDLALVELAAGDE